MLDYTIDLLESSHDRETCEIMKEAYAQCVLTLTAAKIRKKTQAMLLRELKLKGFSDRAMQRILDDITTGRNDSIGSDGDRKIAEHADRVIR